MGIDWSIKVTDLAIIFATMVGPVLAVQAQKWLERRGEVENRQRAIFRTLMATRASSLSLAHVEALNAVPIEFFGIRDVIEAWKLYLDHMGKDTSNPSWSDTRITLLVDMLHGMAMRLGYTINKVEIKNEVYSPRKHGEVESDQDVIRRGLAGLLSGQIALPMDVKSFPVDPAAIAEQQAIRVALQQVLAGSAPLSVKIEEKKPTS